MDLFEYIESRNKDFDLEGAKATAKGRQGHLLAYLIEHHVGKSQAIKAWELAGMFGDKTDRPTRLAIQTLRNEGHLILSSSHGQEKGYYMADSLEEYQEFRQYNFRARAMSILVTDRAMAAQARKQFGDTIQLELL